MSETKFTEGPWEVGPAVNDKKWVLSFDFDPVAGCEYASLNEYNKIETDANLNLIAAAPEMYATLEQLVQKYDSSVSWEKGWNQELSQNAHAVLAKARGIEQ